MAKKNRTVLRVLKRPSGSFFLFGPRGSGKSTWARAGASRTEVDFLLRKGGRFVALEVKSSRHLSADDFRGLRAVTALEGLSRRILVAPVAGNRTTEDGIDVWTLDALKDPEALRAALA